MKVRASHVAKLQMNWITDDTYVLHKHPYFLRPYLLLCVWYHFHVMHTRQAQYNDKIMLNRDCETTLKSHNLLIEIEIYEIFSDPCCICQLVDELLQRQIFRRSIWNSWHVHETIHVRYVDDYVMVMDSLPYRSQTINLPRSIKN